MFLGRQLIRKGKTATVVSVSTIPSPREPLLFLYSPWVRAATTCGGQLDSRSDAVADVEVPDVQPAASHADTPVTSSTYADSHESPHYKDRSRATNQLLSRNSTAAAGSSSVSALDLHTVQIASRVTDTKKVRNKGEAYRTYQRILYQAEVAQQHESDPVDWRKVLEHLELHTPNRSKVWHNNVLQIKIPIDAVADLLFSYDDTIWQIKEKTGCEIQLVEAWDKDEDFRSLLLSGQITSVAKAAAEIMHIAPRAVSSGHISTAHTSGMGTLGKGSQGQSENPMGNGGERHEVRRLGVQTSAAKQDVVQAHRSQPRKHDALPVRVDQIVRPEHWTKASFGYHIQRLVRTRMTNTVASVLYGKTGGGFKHNEAVRAEIQSVFQDPKAVHAISTTAINDAMAWLTHHNQMEDVRQLFVHIELRGVRMDAKTFNIMLRGAAKAQDLRTFQFVLRLMAKRSYIPDPDTWIAFMHCTPNIDIKARIFAAMSQKELTHSLPIQRAICQQFISHDMEQSLRAQQSQVEFVAHMLKVYGPGWLSLASAKAVITGLASKGLISRCWEFLQFMHTHGIHPDTSTINIILTSCRDGCNPQGSVELLDRVSHLVTVPMDEITYSILFQTAWESRMFNMLTVIWRYACLDGMAGHSMRTKVRNSIQKFFSQDKLSLSSGKKAFAVTAGPLVLGTSMLQGFGQDQRIDSKVHASRHQIDHTRLDSYREVIASSLQATRWSHELDESSSKSMVTKLWKEKHTMRVLVGPMTRAFEHLVPDRHFVDMLVEAWELDAALHKQWTDEDYKPEIENDMMAADGQDCSHVDIEISRATQLAKKSEVWRERCRLVAEDLIGVPVRPRHKPHAYSMIWT